MTTFYVEPFVLPYIPTDFEDMDWSIANINSDEEGQASPGVPYETPDSTPDPEPKFNRQTPVYDMVQYLLSKDRYAKKGGKLFVYQDGVYKDCNDYVDRTLYRLMSTAWSDHKATNVKKGLLVNVPYLEDKPDPNLINVLNGIYDLSENKLLPSTPDLLTTIQLPVVYDFTKGCPNISKFINEVFPADTVTFAYEWIGYLMSANSTMHVALLLVGDGRNGKSTFLNLCQSLIGEANYTNIPLQEMKMFRVAEMYGKLANICADLPPRRVLDTDIAKNIIAGDTVYGEFKFQQGFSYESYTRLMFACNEIPDSKDVSDGFKERFKVVPFTTKYIDTPDRNLISKLTTPDELSGLLNIALEAWSKAKARGHFSTSKALEYGKELFTEAIDPIALFLKGATVMTPDATVSKKELYEQYKNWCITTKHGAFNDRNFNKHVAKNPQIVTVEKKGYQHWKGIGLKADDTYEAMYEEHLAGQDV